MSDTPSRVQLVGVHCPDCRSYIQPVALEAGPQVVRHYAQFERDGERVRCNRTFVAVPDPERRSVELARVEGRYETERVLRDRTVTWLHALQAALLPDSMPDAAEAVA